MIIDSQQVKNSEEAQEMQIDSQSVAEKPLAHLIPKISSNRVPLFTNLDSKMCMSTILGYAFTWDQVQKFFNLVSKKGQAYFETNQNQLRHFIND